MTEPADHVDAAVAATLDALRTYADRDWATPTTDLDWSVGRVAHHIGDCLLGYAGQVVLEPTDRYLRYELVLESEPGTENDDRLELIVTGGAFLASVVRTASPEARGWHPYGTSDPTGFAAMGVIESLIHTHDVVGTFGGQFVIPDAPAEFAITRLFRDAPDFPDAGPAQVLLWCCGRIPLGDHPRRGKWRWNGTV
jgi:hypothetical protein